MRMMMPTKQQPPSTWVKGPNEAWLVKFFGTEPPPINFGVEVTSLDGTKKRAVVLEVSKRLGSTRDPFYLLFTDQSAGNTSAPKWAGFNQSELGPDAKKQEALPMAEAEQLILRYLRKHPDLTVRELFHSTKTGCQNVKDLNSRVHNMEEKGLLESTKLSGQFSKLVEERGGQVTWHAASPEIREQRLASALESLFAHYPEIRGLRGSRELSDGSWDFEFNPS